MSFPAFLRTRWAALRPVWARMLQRPEKLLSLHSLLWALIAAGLAMVLYVLVLIPFTPAISDIRKAKTEQPAQLVAADGKLLAEYRWVNRAWVPLAEIAPPVVDALVATEDHRFYGHWGLDKDEILETYLNTVPFLYNAYGNSEGHKHHGPHCAARG